MITSVTDILSNEKYHNKEESISNDESEISKDISSCNRGEIHSVKNGGSVQGNSRETVCDSLSYNQKNNCRVIRGNQGELQNNEVFNTVLAGTCLDVRMDLNASTKENEVTSNDKHFDNNRGNNHVTDKILPEKFLDLEDSNSEMGTNLYKISNKKLFSIGNNHHLNSSKIESMTKIMDSKIEDEMQAHNINGSHGTIDKIMYRALVDSESEEETKDTVHNSLIAFDNDDINDSKHTKKVYIKKRKGTIRDSKDEAMHQIHSETQRLLRETEISLPYHRPRQRTLQEFLNRRKLASLPKAPSITAKLKMSSAIVSQALAEKEKEAELFYKSSESEEEMQQPISSLRNNKKKCTVTNEKLLWSNIEDTQKMEEGIQDSKREIMQQGHLDGPDAAKVFGKTFCETDQDKELSLLTENNCIQSNGSSILIQQTAKEYKQTCHSISRRLFDTNLKNEMNEIPCVSPDQQEVMAETVETVVTALDNKKRVNDKNELSNCVAVSHTLQTSQVYRCDPETTSEIVVENPTIETMKIPKNPYIDNEQITKTLVKNNYITSNIISFTNSDYHVGMQVINNAKQDKHTTVNDMSPSTSFHCNDIQVKNQNNLLIAQCKSSDDHVPGLSVLNKSSIDSDQMLSDISSSKVTLKGSPGMIIDLADDVESGQKGINTLLNRFFCKHIVNTNKPLDNTSEITVICMQDTQNGPVPIKETLPYKFPINADNSELNKPGAKLMRLKEDLKLQMALKRDKEWKQKKVKLLMQEREECTDEEESNDLEEKEDVNYSQLNDSEESEPEENDICIKDKKRSRSLFVDDEAEVTDNESSSRSTEEIYSESDTHELEPNKEQSANFRRENKKENIDGKISETEINQIDDSLDEYMENASKTNFKDGSKDNVCKNLSTGMNERGKMKQLIQEFKDDSYVMNSNDFRDVDNLTKITTSLDTFETCCKNETNEPAFQQHTDCFTRSQICKTPLTKTSMLDFVSPITQLSVLNTTIDSNKKDPSAMKESLIDKDEAIFMESTQNDKCTSKFACNVRNETTLHRRLFDDIEESMNDEYLMQLCSGKFESTQRSDLDLKDLPSQSNVSESRSHELHSESFKTKLVDVKQPENSRIENGTSQDNKIMLNEDSNSFINYAKGIKHVGANDPKFRLRIASSDDEDDSDEIDAFSKRRKHTIKRLSSSDSEDESVRSFDDRSDVDNEEMKQYLDYDSEENEVIIVPKKDIKKVAADFVEEEAELSGSDWESADEDENDLDKLEFEDADNEHVDEEEVKDQLEKIHMRQILDEDKREVRLLKELLFEDGDLYTDGKGRERKFKWKNIDKLGSNIGTSHVSEENDGWVDVQEDEEEAKWNKLRQERDKFLEERKSSTNEIEDDLHDSKIFKFGLEAFKKVKGNKFHKDDSLDTTDSVENMEPIVPRNITDLLSGPNNGKKSRTIYNIFRKRSLLTRGKESLARIASLTRQSDPISNSVNTRNFVFQYIDLCTNNTSKEGSETKGEHLRSRSKPQKREMTSNFTSTIKKKARIEVVNFQKERK